MISNTDSTLLIYSTRHIRVKVYISRGPGRQPAGFQRENGCGQRGGSPCPRLNIRRCIPARRLKPGLPERPQRKRAVARRGRPCPGNLTGRIEFRNVKRLALAFAVLGPFSRLFSRRLFCPIRPVSVGAIRRIEFLHGPPHPAAIFLDRHLETRDPFSRKTPPHARRNEGRSPRRGRSRVKRILPPGAKEAVQRRTAALSPDVSHVSMTGQLHREDRNRRISRRTRSP